MSIILIVMMLSQVFAYVQIYQIVHIKYVQPLYVINTSITLLKNKVKEYVSL